MSPPPSFAPLRKRTPAWRAAQNARNYAVLLVFAASLTAILPVIAVFLIFQRHFVQGLTAGAVKG